MRRASLCALLALGCVSPRSGNPASDGSVEAASSRTADGGADDAASAPDGTSAADDAGASADAPAPAGMQRLTLGVQGPGRIDVAPLGLRCESSACQFDVPQGTMLTLSAVASDGPIQGAVRFLAWADACTGADTCRLTLDVARAATARFHRVIVWEQRMPSGALLVRGDELYLAGRFVAGQTISGQAPMNRGMDDGFLARLAVDGTLRWVKGLGGPMNDEFWTLGLGTGTNIVVSGTAGSDGVLYDGKPLGVTGNFRVTVGPEGELRGVTPTTFTAGMIADGNGNMLAIEDRGMDTPRALVKRDATGQVIWSKAGSSGTGFFLGPFLDSNGNVFAVQVLDAPVSIAGGSFTPDNGRTLLVKLSPGGEYLWATQVGSDSGGGIGNVRLDNAGDVYLSLNFIGRLRIGSQLDMSVDGGADVGFAKLSAARGELIWYRSFASQLPDSVGGFNFDSRGQLVGLASFLSSVRVGTQMFPRGDLAIRLDTATGNPLAAIDIGRSIYSLTPHGAGDFFYRRFQGSDNLLGRLSLP